jgi:hypothetical protein
MEVRMKITAFLLLLLSATALSQTEKVFRTQFTRPANNTTYTAGDVVCDSAGLPMLLVPTKNFTNGNVVGFKMSVDTPNVTNAKFRLFIFSDSIGLGRFTDNAAFVYNATRDSLCIGWADFTLVATGTGSGSTMIFDGYLSSQSGMSLEGNFRASKVQGLFGVLTATGGWVPKLSGIIRIVIIMEV